MERKYDNRSGYYKPRQEGKSFGEKKYTRRDGDKPFKKSYTDKPKKTYGEDKPYKKPVREERPVRSYEDLPAQAPAAEEESDELLLEGRHAVREAIRSGRSINRLYYAEGDLEGSAREILADAKAAGIVISAVDRTRLDKMSQTHHHQGFIAVAAPFEYTELHTMIDNIPDDGLIVVLDGINDVHNLGSIIRTAVCVGADGLVIPKHRAAAVNATVVRTSAGAAEYLPIARVTNISAALSELKDAGYWVSGADMDGESMYACDFKGKTVLVIGNEGEGISRLVRENCDRLVSIPQTGTIDSLNASVAAAVLLYEAYRQRK